MYLIDVRGFELQNIKWYLSLRIYLTIEKVDIV